MSVARQCTLRLHGHATLHPPTVPPASRSRDQQRVRVHLTIPPELGDRDAILAELQVRVAAFEEEAPSFFSASSSRLCSASTTSLLRQVPSSGTPYVAGQVGFATLAGHSWISFCAQVEPKMA